MPQNTYLPVYTADYPILAKAQKPGGVTVLSTVSAGNVPNKPHYSAGTIQMLEVEPPKTPEEGPTVQEPEEEETEVEEPEEEEEEAATEEVVQEEEPHKPRRGGRRR
jgi:hypothetical protein